MNTYRKTIARRIGQPRVGRLLVPGMRRLLVFVLWLAFILLLTLFVGLNAGQLLPALAEDTSDDPLQAGLHKEGLGQSPQAAGTAAGESWMLALVNAENPLPNNHAPRLRSLANGLPFDERAIDQLEGMLAAARAEGLSPLVCSAYRSIDTQRELFDNKVARLRASGMDGAQADAQARREVAYPGTSEHNLGLAADIVSLSYQSLDVAQASTPEFQWLLRHCAEYGFILRYPKDKMGITGVIYEPWHFRYVGVEAATEITEQNLCLEEYLAN
ncbi:MAG: M15 family metallopeptidase [Coriobacteriales bacterium]|jgi:D-alanyl-D-alanine carboxypeptidase|nr:M15 family metallopeptidase [Coriobacteriales bacterium]